MNKNKSVLIIGAGIHGLFMAVNLLQKFRNINIDLVEGRKDICLGTSSATHNRANRGYHYPRSIQTTMECKAGWSFFYKNYKPFYKNISYSYYLIEKKSLTNFHNYKNFLNKVKLPYSEGYPNLNIKEKKFQGSIKVLEGCFNHSKLLNYLKKKIRKKNIKLIKNFEIKKAYFYKDSLVKIISNRNKIISNNYNFIINATYTNVDKILDIFKLKNKKKTKTQNTIIPLVYSKKRIPGFTIMDGNYITVLPLSGSKNKYLIYDVENSVYYRKIKQKYFKIRYLKMIEKLNKYFNFDFQFKLLKILKGTRPVPLIDKSSKRSTIITKNKKSEVPIYSIREGKYISAPLIARNFVKKFKNE